jgi:hypothetical protein
MQRIIFLILTTFNLCLSCYSQQIVKEYYAPYNFRKTEEYKANKKYNQTGNVLIELSGSIFYNKKMAATLYGFGSNYGFLYRVKRNSPIKGYFQFGFNFLYSDSTNAKSEETMLNFGFRISPLTLYYRFFNPLNFFASAGGDLGVGYITIENMKRDFNFSYFYRLGIMITVSKKIGFSIGRQFQTPLYNKQDKENMEKYGNIEKYIQANPILIDRFEKFKYTFVGMTILL